MISNAEEIYYEQNPFVEYNALVTGNFEDDTNTENNDFIGTIEEVLLSASFAKRNYSINEQIPISFKLTSALKGVDTVYNANGFNVIGAITNYTDSGTGCEVYDVVLAYDGITQNPYFSFEIITNSDLSVYATTYGYLSDIGLFISDSSFDSAKEYSYYFHVETGELSMDEFNEILAQEFRKVGTEITETESLSTQGLSGLSGNASTTATTAATNVSGNITWKDDRGVSHPMQYNKVEIWDSRYNQKLGTVYTNVSGAYSFAFTDTYSYRNIYLKIYPGGENSIVKTGNGGEYVYTSSIRSNVALGSSISIGWQVDMSTDLGKAFQISQAINVATKYVKEMNGEYISPVTVKYPHTTTDKGCFYKPSEETIYIKGTTDTNSTLKPYSSWDVLLHEYGHHIQHEFGIARNPGGKHNFSGNLADLNRSKDIGIRLAWGEAYPSVFGGMAQAYYASSLQNIVTVGDAKYESYNNANIDYESSQIRFGEACEGSIVGLLWDLYDTATETHDNVSFTHTAYWDMIINCDSDNLSDFCNYYIDKYATSKDLALGKLLSYYKMSASGLTANTTGTTPSFSWTANGTSSTLQNDKFDLVILGANDVVLLRINNITSTSYTFTEDEWNGILNSYGAAFKILVVAYQTSTPSTGGYYSETLSVAKPAYNQSSDLNQYNAALTRYSEQVITLTPGSYYELHVTFGVTGSKLIQTVGTKDTVIEIFSASGVKLAGDDETSYNGFRDNAFLSYYTYINTEYIIRVRLAGSGEYGTTKIIMTPAEGICTPDATELECFDDIVAYSNVDSLTLLSSSQLDHTKIIVFEPKTGGDYTIEITSDLDTYLYVIDPRSSAAIVRGTDYDDDGGDDGDAKLTRTLTSGIPYLIIFSGYNIENANYTGALTLTIMKE